MHGSWALRKCSEKRQHSDHGPVCSPGEREPSHPAPADPPCLLAQVSTTGHWVPWHLYHDQHPTGIAQDQTQSCSLPAALPHAVPGNDSPWACLRTSIYCVRTNAATVLPSTQAVSFLALLFNDTFFYPTMEAKPFLTLWQHGLDLACKRLSRGSWQISLVFQAFCSPSPVLHLHATKVLSFYFLTHTMLRTPQPLIQSPVKSIRSFLFTWGGLWMTPYVL